MILENTLPVVGANSRITATQITRQQTSNTPRMSTITSTQLFFFSSASPVGFQTILWLPFIQSPMTRIEERKPIRRSSDISAGDI
jgi:hypothetical protein